MLCTRCLPGFPLAATFIIALIFLALAGCGGGDGPAPTGPPARTGGPTSAPPTPEATGAPASPGATASPASPSGGASVSAPTEAPSPTDARAATAAPRPTSPAGSPVRPTATATPSPSPAPVPSDSLESDKEILLLLRRALGGDLTDNWGPGLSPDRHLSRWPGVTVYEGRVVSLQPDRLEIGGTFAS